MKPLRLFAAGFCIAFFVSTAALGQAFGIAQGTSVASLHVVEKIDDDQYEVIVPNPNSNFDSYMVVATPNEGVCKVLGIGKTLRADRDGSQARRIFDDLHEILVDRYGAASNDFDFIRSGALWDGANEWAASIYQNERTKASYWTAQAGTDQPSVTLNVRAVSFSDTYVNLVYEYSNFERCIAHSREKDSSGL